MPKLKRILDALWARRGKVLTLSVFAAVMILASFVLQPQLGLYGYVGSGFIFLLVFLALLTFKVRRYVQVLADQNRQLQAAMVDETSALRQYIAGETSEVRQYADLRLIAEMKANKIAAQREINNVTNAISDRIGALRQQHADAHGDMSSTLKKVFDDISDIEKSIQERQNAESELVAKLDSVAEDIGRDVAGIEEQVENARQTHDQRLEAEIKAVRSTINDQLEAVKSDQDALKSSFAERADALIEQLTREIATLEEKLKSVSDESQQTASANASGLAELQDELRHLRQGLEQRMHHEIEEYVGSLQKSQDELNEKLSAQLLEVENFVAADVGFLRFNRVLDADHVATLQKNWSKRLSIGFTPSSLRYLGRRIKHIESISQGRLATQVEDAVLRTLVAASSKTNKLEVLEIGSLFGIGLSMIYDFAKHRFKEVNLTAIDPLDGYYDSNNLDTLVQIPVNKDNFWSNMDAAGVPKANVTLIDKFSHQDEAIEAAAKKSYDVLIIDGDHSYGGVKADFENYVGLVKRGGYVIIDDYGSDDWPDVTSYVDNEVMGRNDLGFVGIEWRTAVFRVTRSGGQARTRKAPAKAGRRARPSSGAKTGTTS